MMDNEICPIWGTPAQVYPRSNSFSKEVDSPRAGGKYIIDPGAINVGNEDKARLTTWLIEQRKLSVPHPVVNANALEEVKTRPLLSVAVRADRLLTFIHQQKPSIGEYFYFVNKQTPHCTGSDIFLEMKAWSESTASEPEADQEEHGFIYGAHYPDEDQVMYLVKYLENEGFIENRPITALVEVLGDHRNENRFAYVITPEGHAYLDELLKTTVNMDQAFVAMWFDESMDRVYKEAIEPAIRKAGYDPQRIDQKVHNDKIDDQIIAEIKRSRFIIADFTHGEDSGVRGGVYFEAGFALGLGLDVIFTCREDMIDYVHFDTRQYNHLLWKDDNPGDFRKKLADRISATIGDGPHR